MVHFIIVPHRNDITEHRMKQFVLFTANRYGAVLIPAAPGAVTDLVNNQDLAQILDHFIEEKSTLTFFFKIFQAK